MSERDEMSMKEAEEYIERRILEQLGPLVRPPSQAQAAPISEKDSVPQIEYAFPNIFGKPKADTR